MSNSKQLAWVKLAKYCELSGETPDAVKKKRSSGKFLDGVHSRIAPDGNIWINLEEVEKWVTGNQATTLKAVQQKGKLRTASALTCNVVLRDL